MKQIGSVERKTLIGFAFSAVMLVGIQALGVACYPMHGLTGNAITQSADGALYRAKASGRNQVVAAI